MRPSGVESGTGVPSYAAVLRTPRFLPVFLANALSMWGDYIARVTIAAVVFQLTKSPLATATTLAVSLVPSFFGRSLVGPVVDRFPYKWVLIWSHLLRAACVVVLMWLVVGSSGVNLPAVFAVLFLLELVGGASVASNMVLLTDLFDDRRTYARAIGLGAMAEQTNQAIGLALGGGIVALVGAETGLLIDLLTFVTAAMVIAVVVQLRPVSGDRGKGVTGFVHDLRTAAGDLARHPVLARLVLLSAVACLGISAPEALAIPIAAEHGWASWGGVLMASPIVGAILGIVLIGRRDVHQQNRSIVPLALAMPLPLLATAFDPPIVVIAALFVVSGACQAFMVPLQATFALVTEPQLRGRIFSLAGSVSIAAAGAAFLAAGWVGKVMGPADGVAVCAGVCLVLIVLLAISWPHRHVRHAVERAYASPSRAA